MKCKMIFAILMLFTVSIAVQAGPKEDCLREEGFRFLAENARCSKLDAELILDCMTANNRTHSARTAYCNTLE